MPKKVKKQGKNWRKFWKLGVEEFNTQFFGISKDGELTVIEGHHSYNLADLAAKYPCWMRLLNSTADTFPAISFDKSSG